MPAAHCDSNPMSTDIPEHLSNHQYKHALKSLNGEQFYFDVKEVASPETLARLPSAIKVILENTIRCCNGESVTTADVENVMKWGTEAATEVRFSPSRVLLQDLTGVPAVVDLAAMRSVVSELGGEPGDINPLVPTELVVDHSIIVDAARNPDALKVNERMEFERNSERFSFLKWGAQAFKNMRVIPPGTGICHQVNLEYLARGVFSNEETRLCYPDTLVGTDSHTTMISGLGILGWGVGGIEAEAVMLGQPYSLMLPEIVGVELSGAMHDMCTATDLVLTITTILRDHGVVGKIVEFFGPGYSTLSVADRATIANMAPEYGATTGFFPPDERTVEYLRMTGRDAKHLEIVQKYWEVSELGHGPDVQYSAVVKLDLNDIVPAVAGPKRPQDLVAISNLKKEFTEGLTRPVDFSSFGCSPADTGKVVDVTLNGVSTQLRHGSVVIAAITSCTNTSNPAVMIGAGLIARAAIKRGLTVPPYVKTSLSPGSAIVQRYLEASNLSGDLNKLGFYLAGYGCMTCIGNSGELDPEVESLVKKHDLVSAAVLSGNRNFEGRVHPITRANYLASPMLVVIYALAGRVDVDLEHEALGMDSDGKAVYLRDIWPTRAEIEETMLVMTREMYTSSYEHITGSEEWLKLKVAETKMFEWSDESTYIHRPPFFEGMTLDMVEPFKPIKGARVLGLFGDSITTDHISPAGKISPGSPAANWLQGRGVEPRLFNSYGSRRGNDNIMVRGTFANVRLVNKIADKVGPWTKNMTETNGEDKYFYDVAMEYKAAGVPSVLIGGDFYGSGSSRDWAAKGSKLQGVRAVLVKSFERIHRSNLIGMGVLPLQFQDGQGPDELNINGDEVFDFHVGDDVNPLAVSRQVRVTSDKGHDFEVLCRIDTGMELNYYRAGGILNFMIKKMCAPTPA